MELLGWSRKRRRTKHRPDARRILPARFQNIIKADNVAFDVHVGVRDGVPHACLRGEIHDDLRPVSREEVGNQALVGKVSADEREVLERLELCQPRLLEPDVIVVVQVVQPDDVRPRARPSERASPSSRQ